jgi:hypothetical protein
MFQMRRSYLRVLLAVGVCAALVALPATAVAQDALSNPSAAQYVPQSQVQGTQGNQGTQGTHANGSNNGPAAAATAAAAKTSTEGASGTLPFTGMDLAVVAAIAVLMIAAGVALRRLSAPPQI